MATQDVLVVNAGESDFTVQLQQLAHARLAFTFADSAAEARRLLDAKKFSAALVVFDTPAPPDQEEIEQLIAESPAVEWIALVEPRVLESQEFQIFLLQAFHDYHTLPIDPQRLAVTIGHACGKARLRVAVTMSRQAYERFQICGASPAMQAFFSRLEKVIKTDAPILIGGETGTGKELVAQAIHRHSKRSQSPMVVVNCGAIPSNLIQSILFGHEKGAFTGASARHIGKIESANGGVLFLDEIGDLPLDMQTSLLRVLQDRVISRVGSTREIPVDFRVIAATHVDLREAVAAGRFREDLFFRLNVIHLNLPPLRERGSDISLLAENVLQKYAPMCRNSKVKGFSKEALKAMLAHSWPGNVRELINRVQRAMVMSENRLISAADLALDNNVDRLGSVTRDDARASFERGLVESSLRINGNKVSDAARQLGVSRVTFYRMMNKFNILAKSGTETQGAGPSNR